MTARKTLRNAILCLPLAIASVMAHALEAAPVPVRSVSSDPGGVTLKMEPGMLRLQVCSEGIVRVVYCRTDSLPATESFVVVHKWEPVAFKEKESADAVMISTGKLVVKVAKKS